MSITAIIYLSNKYYYRDNGSPEALTGTMNSEFAESVSKVQTNKKLYNARSVSAFKFDNCRTPIFCKYCGSDEVVNAQQTDQNTIRRGLQANLNVTHIGLSATLGKDKSSWLSYETKSM
jgi:hypothetical protein